MRTKKTFVLLEILIGFALVSISILPFLRYPYRHMQKEIDMLFQMQLTRYAQERLCEIERELCAGSIDIEKLLDTKKKRKILQFDPVQKQISLSKNWSRIYAEKLHFEKTAQRASDQTLYTLIHIYLSFPIGKDEKMEFHTELVAQKKL